MPRNIRESNTRRNGQHSEIVSILARELCEKRPSGQPLVDEERFEQTGSVKASVYWDEWYGIPDETRLEIILRAYEEAEGRDFADRIVLAAGYTIPEGRDSGLLRYSIMNGLRKTGPISPRTVARR